MRIFREKEKREDLRYGWWDDEIHTAALITRILISHHCSLWLDGGDWCLQSLHWSLITSYQVLGTEYIRIFNITMTITTYNWSLGSVCVRLFRTKPYLTVPGIQNQVNHRLTRVIPCKNRISPLCPPQPISGPLSLPSFPVFLFALKLSIFSSSSLQLHLHLFFLSLSSSFLLVLLFPLSFPSFSSSSPALLFLSSRSPFPLSLLLWSVLWPSAP